MTVKATIFMGQDKYSWSEAHYFLPTNDFLAAEGPTLSLVEARARCLGRNAQVLGARLSHVPANRQVKDADISGGGISGTWPADPTNLLYDSDRAYSSLLIRMESATGSKNMYLAGVPDGVIQTVPGDRDGFIVVPLFDNVLQSLMNLLTGGGGGGNWGYRSRLSGGGLQATALTTNALFPGEIGVTVPSSLGVVVGDEVYLTGWRRINTRSPGLAGAWQVVGILPPASGPGPWTYFLGRSGNVSPTNFLGLGRIDSLKYEYLSYVSWAIKSSTSRKRGASFGKPVGRSPVRR